VIQKAVFIHVLQNLKGLDSRLVYTVKRKISPALIRFDSSTKRTAIPYKGPGIWRWAALGELHEDIDLFVKCTMNRQGGLPRLLGGLKEVKGDMPLARAWHEEMRKALVIDETTYRIA
jgi:hypothetical protein